MEQTLPTLHAETWRNIRLRLFRFVRSKVRNDHDAEDIVHDVFEKALLRLDTLKNTDALTPWLFQIAMNTIRDRGRHQSRAVLTYTDSEEDIAANDSPNSTELRDLSACVDSMIDNLEEPYRSAVRRSEIQGSTHRAIAEELGISISGVKSRVQRGRVQLKKLLTDCCAYELDSRGRPMIDSELVCRNPECSCGVRSASSSKME